MKDMTYVTKSRIQMGLAVAAIYACSASGAVPLSQTAGWYMGAPTSVVTLPGNNATGGVEFFGLLPAIPAPPPNTFSTIGWGCLTTAATTCAVPLGGIGPWPVFPSTAALGTTATDPFGLA